MFDSIVQMERLEAQKKKKNIPVGISALFSVYDELTDSQKKVFDERFRIIAENLKR